MTSKISPPREFTGRHMALVMGLFFGTIITVNLTMAYFAKTTWSGLVVPNSYVASQTFDADTARRRNEAARGWSAETSYAEGRFRLALADASGRPVTGAVVRVTIGHPVNATLDRTLTLTPTGDGYEGETDLTPGRWEARLAVEAGELGAWHRDIRFSVQ
ncbi:FixH family protein [Aurantimonas sp. 22II-16-19i]|uniref:FixH family protein n=1 Tax=Aurantimonas sp. 22II-16-19i TaxID=1317114 RepID=UPI0009F7BFF4|nr:FixH family protein [Aurantimonas sp. 22II-16-19i]ORE89993.1 nitrogen fixation protein fixH [Aurantimonas sp. 22II-16-19i]